MHGTCRRIKARVTKKVKVTFLTVIPSPYQRQLFRRIAEYGIVSDPGVLLRRPNKRPPLECPGTARFRNHPPRHDTSAPWRHRVFQSFNIARARRSRGSDVVVVSDYSIPTAQIAMRVSDRAPDTLGVLGRGAGPASEGASRKLDPAAPAVTPSVGFGDRRNWLRRRRSHMAGSFPARRCTTFPISATWTRSWRRRASVHGAAADVNVLFSGQLIHRKGVDVLVEAFVRVADAVPSMHLQLMGSGPDRAELEGRIPSTLRDRVSFLGHKEATDLPGVFAKADIFVLPSRHDGWGVVVNEALGPACPSSPAMRSVQRGTLSSMGRTASWSNGARLKSWPARSRAWPIQPKCAHRSAARAASARRNGDWTRGSGAGSGSCNRSSTSR